MSRDRRPARPDVPRRTPGELVEALRDLAADAEEPVLSARRRFLRPPAVSDPAAAPPDTSRPDMPHPDTPHPDTPSRGRTRAGLSPLRLGAGVLGVAAIVAIIFSALSGGSTKKPARQHAAKASQSLPATTLTAPAAVAPKPTRHRATPARPLKRARHPASHRHKKVRAARKTVKHHTRKTVKQHKHRTRTRRHRRRRGR